MGNSLLELTSYMRPLAETLIAKCEAANIPVIVVDTGRTPLQQVQKLAQGVSWTQTSKHLPQPPENLSEAIDIAPKTLISQPNWAPEDPLWNEIGAIGKAIGLTWGGDWPTHRDPGHFEYKHGSVPS